MIAVHGFTEEKHPSIHKHRVWIRRYKWHGRSTDNIAWRINGLSTNRKSLRNYRLPSYNQSWYLFYSLGSLRCPFNISSPAVYIDPGTTPKDTVDEWLWIIRLKKILYCAVAGRTNEEWGSKLKFKIHCKSQLSVPKWKKNQVNYFI